MAKQTQKTIESTTGDSTDVFAAVLEEREAKQIDRKSEDPWLTNNFEGQLAVDVYQTDTDIVIQSTLAGVKVEDIDIAVNNDMVTIRGLRKRDRDIRSEDYFYQECYWGGFSRSIILPVDVKSDKVAATLKNGILTVILPKAETARAKSIRVQEEFDEED